MTISTGFEGSPPDHEVRLYLCRCLPRQVRALERFNGGPWAWRVNRAEHRL